MIQSSQKCLADTNIFGRIAEPHQSTFSVADGIATLTAYGIIDLYHAEVTRKEISDIIYVTARNNHLRQADRQLRINSIKTFLRLSKKLKSNKDIETIKNDLVANAISDEEDAWIVATCAYHKMTFLSFDYNTIKNQPHIGRIQTVLSKYSLKLHIVDEASFVAGLKKKYKIK